MKLSTKIALGFGAAVTITAVLGVACWIGLKSIDTDRSHFQQGQQISQALGDCASLRRDFAIAGFEKTAGENQNAAEKWLSAHGKLAENLKDLENSAGLGDQHREIVRKAIGYSDAYKAGFDTIANSRKSRDQACAEWRNLGDKITGEVATALNEVIKPAIAKAKSDKKFEDMEKWSDVAIELDHEFVNNFLLMRICGVNLIATGAEPQWVALQSQIEETKKGLAKWSSVVAGNTQLEAMAKNLTGFVQQYETTAKSYQDGLLTERSANATLGEVAGNVVASVNELTSQLSDEMQSVTARVMSLIVVMGVGAIILGAVLAVLITRSIVKPINRIIAGLNDGADQVNDAAAQVAGASQQLAEGASEQASSLEETSSALEEMAAMTRTNAGNANEANTKMESTRKTVEEGNEAVTQASAAMTQISEASDQISKIIKVIEEIAFQTNLLALNAAVEAARAGEHGKGFAVVADEVRNLAQRAAKAAKETGDLIEQTVQRVHRGVELNKTTCDSFTNIAASAQQVATLVHQIAQASNEQAQGVDQVNVAVSQMDKVTQANAANAEESAAAAEELSAQAQSVRGLVNELVSLVTGQSSSEVLSSQAASRSRAPARTKPTKAASKPAKVSAAQKGSGSSGESSFLSMDDNDSTHDF